MLPYVVNAEAFSGAKSSRLRKLDGSTNMRCCVSRTPRSRYAHDVFTGTVALQVGLPSRMPVMACRRGRVCDGACVW